MTHSLKIWPQYYAPVAAGLKTFEIRKNDRGFQAGDIVSLREYDPTIIEKEETDCHNLQTPAIWKEERGFTSSPVLEFKIGYVFPIDAERVVFSLIKIEGPK